MAFTPRPGQRVKFHLPDPWKQAVSQNGGHLTPDGYFLGTFIQSGTGPRVSHRKGDGVEVTDESALPARIMCVDKNDHNVMLPFRDEALGHAEFRPACFLPEDVLNLCPLDDTAHLPPGAKISEGWKPEEQLIKERRAAGK
jgi:hypothetical protein